MIDTQRNAVDMYNHTSTESGAMNENRVGGSFIAFVYKIPIPKRHVNGLTSIPL